MFNLFFNEMERKLRREPIQHNHQKTYDVSQKIVSNTNKNIDDLNLASQNEIKKTYKKLQNILQETQKKVFELDGVNTQFNKIKNEIAFAFALKIGEAQKELEKALKETVWDNLVIAFFGETNAGKSTIIETFRILFDDNRKKEDGLIVGDGRHDFTRTYEEYNLSISAQPFTLIDVPGIEGDEADFKDIIKTALHKAHCVFYVQGYNKKPDRATAEKIKKYLGDWVKVYSIYNVRGSVSNYDEDEERETLLTSDVQKTESLIQSEFETILGDVYAGNVTLQGLLAMSAKATFSPKREDLIKGQQKLLRYFGESADKVLQFSQFKTLMNLVEQKSLNFKFEIIEANKQKLISLANKISEDVKMEMNSQKKYLLNLEVILRSIMRDVCNNSLDTAVRKISYMIENEIDKSYYQMKSEIFQLIDKKTDNINQKAVWCQQKIIKRLADSIKSIVDDELEKVRATACRKIKDLDGVNIKPIVFNESAEVGTEIDFTEALEELNIDLADVLKAITGIANATGVGALVGSFIPYVGSLVGAGVGAAVGSIAQVCSRDGGKDDAKKSVMDAINKAKQQAKSNVTSKLSLVFRNIDEQKRQLRNSIKRELTNIEDLKAALDDFSDGINDLVNEIKHKRYGSI